MSTETLFSLLSGLVALAGFITVFIQVGRWSQRLENRIQRLEEHIDALDGRLESLYTFSGGFYDYDARSFGVIVQLLHRRQALDDNEMIIVSQTLTDIGRPPADALLGRERRTGNPLSHEELDRLEGYLARARAGERLTLKEVRDFRQMVRVLEQEHPTDPGIWPLIAVGAFLEGRAQAAEILGEGQ